VPSFVEGVDPASITWGSSDPTMVDMQPYVTGIMITTKKAGDVTIVARTASACGSAPLHITQFTADDWNTGNNRYNNGGALNVCFDASGIYDVEVPDGFDGNISGFDASGYLSPDGGNCMNLPAGLTNPFECVPPPACTNCHGPVGNGTLFGKTLFTDVAHTPEQTGGFSDTELVNIRARHRPARWVLRQQHHLLFKLASSPHVDGHQHDGGADRCRLVSSLANAEAAGRVLRPSRHTHVCRRRMS
jgi:hypothetical protein